MATPRRADRRRIRNHAESPAKLAPACAQLLPAPTPLRVRAPAAQLGQERWRLPVHSGPPRSSTPYGSSSITLNDTHKISAALSISYSRGAVGDSSSSDAPEVRGIYPLGRAMTMPKKGLFQKGST